MKFVVALVLSTFAFSALAQKHMVNFDTGEIIGNLNWNQSKTKGSDASKTENHALTLNYAYTLLPKVQVGGKVNYEKESMGSSKYENYGFQVGAIYNHGADIRSSYYASAYVGMNWANDLTAGAHDHRESLKTTVAVGKRIPLSIVNLENVVYSPELSWESINPTKSTATEWDQNIKLKVLNFSVFF